LTDETVFSLGGLSLPAAGPSLAQSEAVQLFLQSARRIKPDYELVEAGYQPLIEICRLVEGMPLAIILAAGWLEVLGLEEIVLEIQRGLDILESDWQDAPSRQRSMRAVFDSSWQRLSGEEQQALMRLSLFRDAATREAAQEVAGANLRLLLSLANQSWLQRTAGGRYHIHELLRQFAAGELLEDGPAWQVARQAYIDYYVGLFSEQNRLMKGPQQRAAHRIVANELGNARVPGIGSLRTVSWSWLSIPCWSRCSATARGVSWPRPCRQSRTRR
jgi:predicted ATPase